MEAAEEDDADVPVVVAVRLVGDSALRCEMFSLTFLSELLQQFLCPATCKGQELLSRYALILTPSLSTIIFQILAQNVFVSIF